MGPEHWSPGRAPLLWMVPRGQTNCQHEPKSLLWCIVHNSIFVEPNTVLGAGDKIVKEKESLAPGSSQRRVGETGIHKLASA